MTPPLTLANYRLLGSSGLRVSPLCLGTMTFGEATWGMDRKTARSVFDAHVNAGGNFIDTANFYAQDRRIFGGTPLFDTPLRDPADPLRPFDNYRSEQ